MCLWIASVIPAWTTYRAALRGSPLKCSEIFFQCYFVLCKRFAAALAENIELGHIVLEQVRCHFRLLERVANADGRDVAKQDVPKLVHRLCVNFQRLLEELHTHQLLRPLR